jgi:hypothetical protein
LTVALVILRIALAAVFAVAGIAKLAALRRTAARVRQFGVPEAWARPLAVAIPVTELVIVALILPDATARAGGVLAAMVLVVFSGAIVRLLLRGEAPDCNCFGVLHSSRVGPWMLVRNVGLAAGAAVVAMAPASGIPVMPVAWIAVVAVAGCATFGIARRRERQQLRRRHGAPPAQRA